MVEISIAGSYMLEAFCNLLNIALKAQVCDATKATK